MKHFVTVGLLTVLMGSVGCLGYHGATSPYYTNYYNTYDSVHHCYYHRSCCTGTYGYGNGFVSSGRHEGGHRGGGRHHDSGRSHNHSGGGHHR